MRSHTKQRLVTVEAIDTCAKYANYSSTAERAVRELLLDETGEVLRGPSNCCVCWDINIRALPHATCVDKISRCHGARGQQVSNKCFA